MSDTGSSEPLVYFESSVILTLNLLEHKSGLDGTGLGFLSMLEKYVQTYKKIIESSLMVVILKRTAVVL